MSVYIVGSLLSLDDFVWPEKSNAETNISTVLDDNPSGAKQLSPQVAECLEVWNEFLSSCPEGVDLPSFPLWSMEATYPYEKTTPHALKVRFGKDGLKGFKGSHGIQVGYLKSRALERITSHARTTDMNFPKWKQNFIRQNRQFYENNKAWIALVAQDFEVSSSLQKLEWNIKGGSATSGTMSSSSS